LPHHLHPGLADGIPGPETLKIAAAKFLLVNFPEIAQDMGSEITVHIFPLGTNTYQYAGQIESMCF
jgi:hypothetical protein